MHLRGRQPNILSGPAASCGRHFGRLGEINHDGPTESVASRLRSLIGSETDVTSSLRAALPCAARLKCQSGQRYECTFHALEGIMLEPSSALGCRLAKALYDSWRRGLGCQVHVNCGCVFFDGSQHVMFLPNMITEITCFGQALRLCEALLDE